MTLPDDMSKLILVSIRIPGLELKPTNPAFLISIYAGGLFADLLTVELEAEKLLLERPLSGPMPFMGLFAFTVEDVRTAGVIIRTVLRRTELESFATVFQFCPGEGVWKSMYPEGLVMLHEHLMAESVAIAAQAKEANALWQQAARDANTGSNDTPGQ